MSAMPPVLEYANRIPAVRTYLACRIHAAGMIVLYAFVWWEMIHTHAMMIPTLQWATGIIVVGAALALAKLRVGRIIFFFGALPLTALWGVITLAMVAAVLIGAMADTPEPAQMAGLGFLFDAAMTIYLAIGLGIYGATFGKKRKPG